VTIETGRADDAIKVPNAALRFRPTQEAFEALGQKAPEPRQRPDGQSPSARGQQGGSGGNQSRERGDGTQRNAVWVLAQNTLKRVPVQVGISDGTSTAVTGSDLAPGTRVVTGVTTASATPAAAPAGSPLIPAGRRGFGGGAGGGGNNGGGRR
jgi:HlyD family secretion protein